MGGLAVSLTFIAIVNLLLIAWAVVRRRRPHPRPQLGRLALGYGLCFIVTPIWGTALGALGALGAIDGEYVDTSQKARILAEGISEAMNCTAFGVLCLFLPTIVALVLFLATPKESAESVWPE